MCVSANVLVLCHLQIVNPHLLKDLTERGLWNEEMKNQLIGQNGSIQVRTQTHHITALINEEQLECNYALLTVCYVM